MKLSRNKGKRVLKVHLKLKYSHVRKKKVWIHGKDVYVLLGEIQKTCF